MDCDSFPLSLITKNIIKDIKNLENTFDFSNLVENHKLFSNKKVVGIFKMEALNNIWIDELTCLRSKCMRLNVKMIVKIN